MVVKNAIQGFPHIIILLTFLHRGRNCGGDPHTRIFRVLAFSFIGRKGRTRGEGDALIRILPSPIISVKGGEEEDEILAY